MRRVDSFTRLWGTNWLVGRFLLPRLHAFGAEQDGVVLDLACGQSPFRDCFPRAKEYIRIDREADAAQGVILGDMLAIPAQDTSVDVVLLFQAITDVPEPWEVLSEVGRVLKPGGRLLVFESVSYPEHDTPSDYYRLMPQGLCYWAERRGFVVHTLEYLGGVSTRLASIWCKLLLGRLLVRPITRPIGYAMITMVNLALYGISRFEKSSSWGSDYFAILESNQFAHSPGGRHMGGPK